MTECQHKFFNELKKNVGRQKLPTGARMSTAPRAILAPPGISCKLPCNSDACSVTVLLTLL